RVDLGIEADGDRRQLARARRLARYLRRAAIAGDLAEQAVKRHRGGGEPDHGEDHSARAQDRQRIGAAWLHETLPPILTRMTRENSRTSARSTAASAQFLARWRRRNSAADRPVMPATPRRPAPGRPPWRRTAGRDK